MATVAPTYEERNFSIGRVFQRAFSTITHNPLVVIGTALVLGALPSVAMNFLIWSATGMRAGSAPDLSAFWGGVAVSWIVAVIIGAIVQGVLTRATVAEYEGHRATLAECLRAALPVILPLIAVGLIFGFGIAVGMFLLVVPGIIIMLMWAVAGPAVVVERDGVMMALTRSQELTKGARWKILGLFLVLGALYLVIFMLLSAVGLSSLNAASAQGLTTMNLVGSVLSAVIMNLLWG